MTIEQRIEALERRCKRLGKTLMGVGTLALFAVVAGTAGWTVAYTGNISPSSITTKEIFIKDSGGKTRLRLRGYDGSVRAYNKAGIARLVLYGSKGIVDVNNLAGKKRLRLVGKYGSISAYDSAGIGRVGLFGWNGTLITIGSNGKKRIVLGESDGETMAFYDSAEKRRIALTVLGGQSLLQLNNAGGGPGITVNGGDGKICFSNPAVPSFCHP